MEEGFHFFQTTDASHLTLAAAFFDFLLEGCFQFRQVQFLQQFLDGFSTHLGLEGAGAEFSYSVLVFLFVQHLFLQEVGAAGIEDNVGCEIEDSFQLAGRDFKNQSDAGRGAFEVPDVGNRAGKGNVAHSFTAHFGACDFYAALVADGASVAHFLVLAAFAFPVLGWSENLFTEETVGFRLQGSVVDGFRLGDFAMGPFKDLFRRGDTDFHGIKFVYI